VGSTLALAHPLYYDRLVQLASTIFGTITRHVRREENHVAHMLADLAVRDNVNMVWLYNLPGCIQEHVQADISALSDMF
jgi:hypothetical protein